MNFGLNSDRPRSIIQVSRALIRGCIAYTPKTEKHNISTGLQVNFPECDTLSELNGLVISIGLREMQEKKDYRLLETVFSFAQGHESCNWTY